MEAATKKAKHAEAQKRYTQKQQKRGAKRMCVWVPDGKMKLTKTFFSYTHSTGYKP